MQGGEPFTTRTLSGGVSCDVVLINEDAPHPFVVKRALRQLRVAVQWLAPPRRAETEVAGLKK